VDEEFAHDGDEGNFVGLTGGAQALVNGLEDGVAARGGEGRHVEGQAHVAATSANGAGAAIGAAVAVEWMTDFLINLVWACAFAQQG